jgi:NAD(P)-dependent dehydrogenase (short-subunit alcohol dehydrogenase family)
MFDLNGKGAVVTGGGKGLGRAIARSLVTGGADVVVAGRDAEALDQTVNELRALGGQATPIVTDITKRADLDHLVEAAVSSLGVIDCWVNNAGSANPADVGPLLEVTESGWDSVLDLNLKWTFFAAQAAAQQMVGRGGCIINLSSRSGSQPNPMTGQYGAAKAGVENLTATMAVEWGHHGIRVNAVAPGVVPTEISTAEGGNWNRPSRVERQIASVPLRRVGKPDDVGALVAFLASDEASWITGEVIQITGGSRITVGYLTYMHHITEQLKEEAAAESERQ